MATRTTGRDREDAYLRLVLQVPLRPIRSDEELDRATRMIDALLDKEERNQDEQDYLDVLSDLVERYESEEYPMAPVSDAEMLRHLIEARGVSQADVARDAGIAESTVSEVLAGKRNLSRSHIGKLARYFSVAPGVFRF